MGSSVPVWHSPYLTALLPCPPHQVQVSTEPRVEQFFVVRSKLDECATLPLERQVRWQGSKWTQRRARGS